eukprot:766755-Hanusia_phi.AAC.2
MGEEQRGQGGRLAGEMIRGRRSGRQGEEKADSRVQRRSGRDVEEERERRVRAGGTGQAS